jgi:hypothetical protein
MLGSVLASQVKARLASIAGDYSAKGGLTYSPPFQPALLWAELSLVALADEAGR